MLAQDRKALTGLYETKLISEVIQAAFFKNKKAVGVKFKDYFNPISLVTIALVFTAVSACFVTVTYTDKICRSSLHLVSGNPAPTFKLLSMRRGIWTVSRAI
jgi:hypothetical protein